MSNMLCPPLNYELTLLGKKTSDTFARFRVAIEKCNDTIDPGCISAADFAALEAQMTEFSIALPLINTKINPSNSVYKSVFL